MHAKPMSAALMKGWRCAHWNPHPRVHLWMRAAAADAEKRGAAHALPHSLTATRRVCHDSLPLVFY